MAGKWTGAVTVENSMEFLQRLIMELPYDIVIPHLGIYAKKLKTLIGKNIQPYVHCGIIYNSQDLEAIQVSLNR